MMQWFLRLILLVAVQVCAKARNQIIAIYVHSVRVFVLPYSSWTKVKHIRALIIHFFRSSSESEFISHLLFAKVVNINERIQE